MARYKTRAETNRESLILKYMNMRKAMVEIRVALKLGERAKVEDVVEAVKQLVAKSEGGPRENSD